MTPIPPSSVLFVPQAGYSATLALPLMLDSTNGIQNESKRLNRPGDPKFTRLVELIREGQLADAVQIRIKRPKEGPESSVVACGPSKDPQIAAEARELKNLLGLKPDIQEVNVYYGGYSGKDNEIDMMTRSMLQIMQEFARIVLVPETDFTGGRAYPGLVDTRAGQPQSGPTMKIFSGNAASKDGYVALQYDHRWFWIADTDIQSQATFGAVILLFSISETGVKGAPPVVTIPANP